MWPVSKRVNVSGRGDDDPSLANAAGHGVQIHTYLDGTQLAERELTKVFHDLAETPGVELLSAGLKHKDLCV